MYYIFDLDGTLSCGQHRLHLLPPEGKGADTKDWDEFNMAADKDLPLLDNIKLLRELHHAGNTIIILTGRCDISKELTEKWLEEHSVPYHQLIMRPEGDNRPDIVFKEEKLREIGLENIVCAFDDLPHVVSHLRSMGLTCHHVCEPYADYAERNRRGHNSLQEAKEEVSMCCGTLCNPSKVMGLLEQLG